MPSTPLVTVIILNYESFHDTVACIDFVHKSNYPNYRLLVIDNNSPDNSGRKLQEFIKHDKFLQLKKNTGYAEGNNIGIRRVLGFPSEYIFILNPDVRISTDTISLCVDIANSDFSIGAINPVQLKHDGETLDRKFRRSVLPRQLRDMVFAEKSLPKVIETQELLGAALFLSAHAIKRVGGFDPLYFAYGEETDLCRRLRYHGLRLVVAGQASVRHLRTKESRKVSDRVLFLRLRGIYLGMLKDPWRSFRISLKLVTIRFLQELLGKKRDAYPFNQYPVTRLHSILAFLWVLVHLWRIRRHRRFEKLGRTHV